MRLTTILLISLSAVASADAQFLSPVEIMKVVEGRWGPVGPPASDGTRAAKCRFPDALIIRLEGSGPGTLVVQSEAPGSPARRSLIQAISSSRDFKTSGSLALEFDDEAHLRHLNHRKDWSLHMQADGVMHLKPHGSDSGVGLYVRCSEPKGEPIASLSRIGARLSQVG